MRMCRMEKKVQREEVAVAFARLTSLSGLLDLFNGRSKSMQVTVVLPVVSYQVSLTFLTIIFRLCKSS
jgi:hypothetical protein